MREEDQKLELKEEIREKYCKERKERGRVRKKSEEEMEGEGKGGKYLHGKTSVYEKGVFPRFTFC